MEAERLAAVLGGVPAAVFASVAALAVSMAVDRVQTIIATVRLESGPPIRAVLGGWNKSSQQSFSPFKKNGKESFYCR
jgi:hypothetical protein